MQFELWKIFRIIWWARAHRLKKCQSHCRWAGIFLCLSRHEKNERRKEENIYATNTSSAVTPSSLDMKWDSKLRATRLILHQEYHFTCFWSFCHRRRIISFIQFCCHSIKFFSDTQFCASSCKKSRREKRTCDRRCGFYFIRFVFRLYYIL